LTHIVLTGASGRCVDVDADGADLTTVARTARALWQTTSADADVPRAGAGIGFTQERRWSDHHDPIRRASPVVADMPTSSPEDPRA
jgi:hypothetical protein